MMRQRNRNRSGTWYRMVASVMSSTMNRQSEKSCFGNIVFGSNAPEATLGHNRKDGSCDNAAQENRNFEVVITYDALPC
jgi:exo-beta-1,3-glucanase (GH17 family)